ncbi:MAG: GNAT family N-acetyltransferase [Caldilineaceae bacterium]
MTILKLQEISPTQLAEAADANFVCHASWAHQRTPGMTVLDDERLFIADSGLPCDTFNIIARARLSAETAPMRIEAALAYFRQVRRPFSWWVGPADRPETLGALLIAAGLEEAETEVAMATDLTMLPVHDPTPAGLTIRRARTPQVLKDFAQIMAANWTPPDPAVLDFYTQTAAVLLAADSPQWFYVGYWAGEAVAVAELTFSGGVVGLYSICTLENYRQRGFGTALTLCPLLDAQAAGYRVGVLQAAGVQGMRIYARLGFRQFGQIAEYKPPA